MQKSINELSITELKAMAYDCIMTINRTQGRLNIVTREMSKKDIEITQIIKNKIAIKETKETKK